MLTFLAPRVAKWWLPDDVVFVDELPHTGSLSFLSLSLCVSACLSLSLSVCVCLCVPLIACVCVAATGKLSKLTLREKFKDYRLPTEDEPSPAETPRSKL